MSLVQSALLLSVRWTLNERVLTSQPSITLDSEGCPSAWCLIWFMISALCVVSCCDGGLKRHSSDSGTACVMRRWLSAIVTVAMNMLSMKLLAMISLGGRFMMGGSALPNSMASAANCGVGSRKSNLD